jgi:preprotein translocase subunit SecY
MLLYFLLIVGFTYFYVAITFNPDEVAENMKKYGGFIPGIRAGPPDGRVPRLRAHPHHAARLVLPRPHRPAAAHRVQPRRAPTRTSRSGGRSILIIVGVGLETVKQIDAQLQQRHYEGLLR